MFKKESHPDQCCRVELDNGISLSIERQNTMAWSVTAKLELLLDEYQNLFSHDEAEFIVERLSQKYSHINVEELLQLSD